MPARQLKKGPDGAPQGTSEMGYQELKNRICAGIRGARRDSGLSQEALGHAIGLSRYTVIRLESGEQDLRPEQAVGIEGATGAGGLKELVSRRDRATELRSGAPERNVVVRGMLERPGIYAIDALIVDDLDLFELLNGNSAVDGAQVRVAIPTRAREEQLFAGARMYGHYEHQLKRLSDLAARPDRGPALVHVYESDRLLQPALVVQSQIGSESATWPVLPVGGLDGRIEGGSVPVAMSDDPAAVGRVRANVEDVIQRADRIRKLEALAVLVEDGAGAAPQPIRFNDFVEHGGAEEAGSPSSKTGFPVSLILVHGIATRDEYPPAHRLVLHLREHESEDDGVWSLPSNRVDEVDIRRALERPGREKPDERRSVKDSLSAAAEVGERLWERPDPSDQIPTEAFQFAAARELLTMFGLDLEKEEAMERIVEIALPAELRLIDKRGKGDPNRRPILPRFFHFQFRSDDERKLILESRVTPLALGYEDFPGFTDEHGNGLNDFLVSASKDGWLESQLRDELKIAPR